jgi:hypothetical protein
MAIYGESPRPLWRLRLATSYYFDGCAEAGPGSSTGCSLGLDLELGNLETRLAGDWLAWVGRFLGGATSELGVGAGLAWPQMAKKGCE